LALKISFLASMLLLPWLVTRAARGHWLYAIVGVALLALDVYLFIVANNKAKAVLRDKYGITPTRFLWRTDEFADLQIKEFSGYLAEHGLQSAESIDMLIELFERQVVKRKPTPYATPALLAAVLIPVWVPLLDFSFSNLGTAADA